MHCQCLAVLCVYTAPVGDVYIYLPTIIKTPLLAGPVTSHSTLKTGAEYSSDTRDSNTGTRSVITQKVTIKISYTHFTYCI
jgi:hypothetical protein